MTITVTEDIVEGMRFALTPNGPSGTRIFQVTTTDSESMIDILSDDDLPQYNDIYPGSGPPGPYGLMFADNIECMPMAADPTLYLITVTYNYQMAAEGLGDDDPDFCTIQIGSSLTSEKTSFDKDDAKLVVTLTDNDDQVAEVDIQVPETVVMFERREGTSPLVKASAYTGKVNTSSVGSYAARTLLCLGIDGTSNDGGISWMVTYRFQYRPDTWDATIVYIDPETDRPHPDINLGTLDGVTVEKIYQEASFSALDLPW